MILFWLLFILLAFFAYLTFYPPYSSSQKNKSEVAILGGLIKIIYWRPYEGIIITRDKRPVFTSVDKMGGKKYIFPILGEEVEARVPLGLEKIRWEDKNKALTKDGIRVKTDVVVEWNVINLEDYVFKINRPTPPESMPYYEYLKNTAVNWIETSIEATIKKCTRRLTTAELMAVASSYSSLITPNNNHSQANRLNNVSKLIRYELEQDLIKYGIEVVAFEIIDVQFEDHIQKALDSIKEAHLAFKRSELEGKSAISRLQPLINELGKDSVVLIEALKASGGVVWLNNLPFFDNLLGKNKPKQGHSNNDDHPLLRK